MSNPIGRELFDFFRDLSVNNDREWFQANKPRFQEQVLEPVYEFVNEVGFQLGNLSPHFIAIPSTAKGSVFRIYRDTRFAKDKTPYKTFQGVRFPHEMTREISAPVFYIHLDPTGVFAGAGSYHPDAKALRKYRQAIVDDPEGWGSVREQIDLGGTFEFGGSSLKRPPRGFPADGPWGEDLKRKDFIAVANLQESEVLAEDFVEHFLGLCRQGAPLVRFLCEATGAPF